MNDPHRIVDEIRAFLQASDQSYKPRLRELAGEYTEACADVNRRLAQCAQLIKQGLRVEAIHHADADPNLLVALGDLDFADRAAWLDLVGIYDLPAPPDLDMANAEHLNGAYAEHDPLKSLMKKHRRLALARAPLRDRLSVLRELARVDPTSPIWAEDMKAFEAERLKQIQAEAADAARRCDTVATDALEGELDGFPWSVSPPGPVMRMVRKAAESVRQESARRALPEAEELLNAAFSALDPAQGRQARSRWLTLVETAKLAVTDPARVRAEPALMWLDEQDRREADRQQVEAAIAELEEALADPTAPRDEIEDLWHALKKISPEVPRAVAQRYAQRIDGFNRSSRRRVKIIISSVAVISLVSLAGIGVMVWWSIRAAERSNEAAAIRAELDGSRIDDLASRLKRLRSKNPALLDAPEVVALMPEVNTLLEKEAKRADAFARLLTEAENAPLTGTEPEPLKKSRELARTDGEKRDAEDLGKRIADNNREAAARRDSEIKPLLEELAHEVNAIEKALQGEQAGDPNLDERVRAAASRLAPASPEGGPLSPTLRARADTLRKRLDEASAETALASHRHAATDALTTAVRRLPDDIEGYVAAAGKLAAGYVGPGGDKNVQAVELDRVVARPERACWESALLWSARARQWAAESRPLAPETARSRLKSCATFLDDYFRSPDAAEIRRHMSYLKPITARDEPNGGLCGRLKQLLSSPSIDPLYVVQYKKDPADDHSIAKYYSSNKPGPPNVAHAVELYYRLNGNGETASQRLNDAQILSRDLAPQSKLAQAVKSEIAAGAGRADWDRVLVDTSRKISLDEKIDPICKLILLNELLKTGCEGSLALRDVMRPTTEKLMSLVPQFREVNWLDPEAHVGEKRAEAEGIVKYLPPWDQVAAAVQKADAQLRGSAADTPRLVGWIDHTPSGFSLRLVVPRAEATTGELVVALPEGDGGEWKSLGTLIGSDITFVPQKPDLAAEGRLVFIRSRKGPAGTSQTRSANR